MASLAESLVRISEWFDKNRPDVKRITVNCTRPTAMNAGARPKVRGGALFFKDRLVCYTKGPRGIRLSTADHERLVAAKRGAEHPSDNP